MTINRWAARADKNRSAIVDAFKKAGCTVYDVRRPCDLLVGIKGITILVEIKTKTGKLTPAQEKFNSDWTGGAVFVVRTIDDVINIMESIT